MPVPSDCKLYEKIKNQVKKDIPTHSAYRSGIIVRKYKLAFSKKHPHRSPYKGKRTQKKGLSRWFKEEWRNQRGDVGYHYKSDVYRPTRRVTQKTPITLSELNSNQLKKARSEKYKKGRIYRFKTGGGWSKKYKSKINCRKPKGFSQRQFCNKTRKRKANVSKKGGKFYFSDYPDFKPNLSPRDIFKLGSFGGTYWRPIKSKFYKTTLRNHHKKYPSSWWKEIPGENLSSNDCNISKNKYKVNVGTSLEFWESKDWINKSHPYGWVEWYCDFFMGNRGEDDERQIQRWKNLAGCKGRFMRFLVTQILKNDSKYNDESISPKIRQVLQHWGYKLTKADFDYELKRRKTN
jgi:hypothetical protein